MNTHDDPTLDPEERAARDAVRRLPRPGTSEPFRQRLRDEFTSGRIARRPPLARPGPWFARPAALVPLASAAALVLVFAANRGPAWQVVRTGGTGSIVVNGRAVAPADAGTLARLIAGGGRLELRDGATLDLVAPGSLALALTNGASAELPPAPDRWWGRAAVLRLPRGNAFITTGRRFEGARLDVETTMARIGVTGTSLAVLDVGDATCICVMEGRVDVFSMHDGTSVPVVPGTRRVVHGHREAETLPMLESSEHELHRLGDATRGALGR